LFVHSSKFCKGFADNCIQPNALDVTIDTVDSIDTDGYFVMRKDASPSGVIKYPIDPTDGVLFDLRPGAYSFESSITVEIPEGIVGWLVARSSLNRNGIFIMSGVYDSGFKGRIGGTIYTSQHMHIEKGARVAQLITATAETFHLYDGQWQGK
jgi:deoxycytidine triphosphate deaminase